MAVKSQPSEQMSDLPKKQARRMRGRATGDLSDFKTFAADVDAVSCGPFRSSVRSFISRYASPTFPACMFSWLMTWQILFRTADGAAADAGSAVIALDIVEEDVTRSRSVYCDQCRVVGWSGHPVCQKRYHFIIRREGLEEGYHKTCTTCGNTVHLSELRCKFCSNVISLDELEDWVYSQFADATHLLHGVIHSNGYGHLLNLNGRGGGSSVLSGSDIMNFWDRLCSILAVRKVSVMDVSMKYGTEYRLLHAITSGRPWYGNWGYDFGAGSYALTQNAYQTAIETLSSVPLSIFNYQGRQPRTKLQATVAFYKSISDVRLVSLRDLFSFILRLIHETQGSQNTGTCGETESSTTTMCAWRRNDFEQVEQAMLKVLLAAVPNGSGWVSRRALKGALCRAASPELIDYCLKHLRGKMTTDGAVVIDRFNSNSASVEFKLEACGSMHERFGSSSKYPSKEHLINDLKFLYDSIVHPKTMVNYRPQSTRELVADSATKLLDCKQFVKDYKPDKMAGVNPFALHIWCHVELADHSRDETPPPPELLILPLNASVADLKLEAAKTFQEVYAMFRKFKADKLLDFGPIDDSMTMKILVGLTGSVRVQGRCYRAHLLSRFRAERGTEDWTVDCMCGARDDDGERMLACDKCGVWQHTRCAGVDNHDAIPEKFVCTRCLNLKESEEVGLEEESEEVDVEESDRVGLSSEDKGGIFRYSRNCRDAAITNGPKLDSNLTMTFGVR